MAEPCCAWTRRHLAVAGQYPHEPLASKYWRLNELGRRFKAHVVVYADDLVILTRGNAVEAHEMLSSIMTRIGLTLNETKTKLREARSERFDFLGYTFGPYWDRRSGKRYLGQRHRQPRAGNGSRKRCMLSRGQAIGTPWDEVCDQLNMLLGGWQGYFRYGTLSKAYSEVNWYVADRVRNFLRRRHKIRSRGSRQFPTEHIHGDRKVRLLRPQRAGAPHALA